jgi:hypothetical protein
VFSCVWCGACVCARRDAFDAMCVCVRASVCVGVVSVVCTQPSFYSSMWCRHWRTALIVSLVLMNSNFVVCITYAINPHASVKDEDTLDRLTAHVDVSIQCVVGVHGHPHDLFAPRSTHTCLFFLFPLNHSTMFSAR